LNPKDHRVYIKDIAEQVGVHQTLANQFITFYYARIRKCLVELKYPRIFVEGLGTFCIRKKKLEKMIKRNRDILGNLDKRQYKGYEKHIAVKEKLVNMETALELMNGLQKDKIKWKKEHTLDLKEKV